MKRVVSFENFLENINNHIPDNAKIISVGGGSGSGKSFIAKQIADKIGAKILAMDDYIIPGKITKDSNWDLLECWDLSLLDTNLRDFLAGKIFKKPVYNFKKSIISGYERFEPADKIIVEGLYALDDLIIKHIDFSIFIDSPESIRLERVLKRDILERNHNNNNKIIRRWNKTIQPAFEKFIQQKKDNVDLIILN